MLAIARLVLFVVLILAAFPFVILYCIVRPRHRTLVYTIGGSIAKLSALVGLEVEVRHQTKDLPQNAVWIANHQNSLDLVTLPKALVPGVVSIGKKSLLWIPFFGIVYWLTGNLMIDRNRRHKAAGTLNQAGDSIHQRDLSVWMFPEGTRSYGRALQPFKTGAFHLAQQSKVPILPICCSSTHNQVKMNRWSNGKVIVEVGTPIDVSDWTKQNFRAEIANVHQQMEQRIHQLTLEARGEAVDYAKLSLNENAAESAE